MENADQKSASYVSVIISLFKNHFPNASLDPDLSTFDGIFDFIIKKYGDFKSMPDNLNDLRNALMDYQNASWDAYQFHIQKGNARNRLNLLKNAVFANASGTQNDVLYIGGNRQNGSWIQLWANITGQAAAQLCCNADCSNIPTDGGHVFTYSDTPAAVVSGIQVDILPICHFCNMNPNLIMTNRNNIYSMVLIWP